RITPTDHPRPAGRGLEEVRSRERTRRRISVRAARRPETANAIRAVRPSMIAPMSTTTVPSRPAAVSAAPARSSTPPTLPPPATTPHALPARPAPTPAHREPPRPEKSAGFCGPDRHIWEWDAWAASRIPVGIVTGHEFVGIVEKVGSAVTKYQPGQRVSAEG